MTELHNKGLWDGDKKELEAALKVQVVSPEVGYLNVRPQPSTERPPVAQVDDGTVLEALEPPWDQLGPVWQLSVGDFRVFYDIVEDDRLVIVRAVRSKPAHRTTDEIL